MRSRISADIWEQIKTGYAAGINLREIARKNGHSRGNRPRPRQTSRLDPTDPGRNAGAKRDAITPVQSVPQSIAAILGERKDRTKLGLSKYAAEAAEQAAEHRDKLEIAGKVKDVAGVHSVLWPEQPKTNQILNVGILTGAIPVYDSKTDEVVSDQEEEKRKELP